MRSLSSVRFLIIFIFKLLLYLCLQNGKICNCMNKTLFPFVIILSLFIIFFSCSNKPNRSRKPVSSISLTPAENNYIYGQSVSVRVITKLKNGEIDKIALSHNGNLIKESKNLDFSIDNIKLLTTGKNVLTVSASKTDGVANSRTISFNVVSDIEPEKFSYSVINNYPHNKKYYTQGLEYHEGYLYEGTGETGSSGLFKVNLNTGSSVLEHYIDKKYFGEGITILNDKIYQITYRAQKGFIYNLHDFALIDSFKYQSKEGWGLTNDGKYLIMSNGTHELIWLDTNDFSEVKKLQIANNNGVVNYLNELEFINGKIYANVYTTNLIVVADPESGRVLSEINMEGIINMYANPSDTIDYLNGIAYDPSGKRLFVTGKWWPRLFEIKLIPSK
jgi:glutaminyl-peptide cyclotransferase